MKGPASAGPFLFRSLGFARPHVPLGQKAMWEASWERLLHVSRGCRLTARVSLRNAETDTMFAAATQSDFSGMVHAAVVSIAIISYL